MVKSQWQNQRCCKANPEHGNNGISLLNNFPNSRCLLLGKVEINNEKLKKMNTSNLKVVKGLSVIMEKKFSLGVRTILHL